jgi:predicted nucleotidyltransferase
MYNGTGRNAMQLLAQCKDVLAQHYGPRFRGLVLYGSLARGQADPESDVDLLVLLEGPLDYLQELRQLVDLLYPLQLESARLISAKPVLAEDYEQGAVALYRNAKREGVTVA